MARSFIMLATTYCNFHDGKISQMAEVSLICWSSMTSVKCLIVDIIMSDVSDFLICLMSLHIMDPCETVNGKC